MSRRAKPSLAKGCTLAELMAKHPPRKARSQADARTAPADPNNVCEEMCPTCPFRPGSKYSSLAPDLAAHAITTGNRVCHSTGPANAINPRPKQPARICRGARNVQLNHFHRLGILTKPTDDCWRETLAKARAHQ